MKICNLGHARSRTSLLTTQLVNYYGCEDIDESYTYVRKKTYVNYFTKDGLSIEQKYLQVYKNNIINYTNSIFENESFIVKLWPRWMNSSEFCQNFDTLILDLDDTFRLRDYDKIMVTKRNPVDALCSLWLATRNGYNFTIGDDRADYFTKRKSNGNNVMPDINTNKWHLSFLTEIFLIDKICEYLDSKNIRYVYLSYEDVPSYLNNEYKLTPSHPNLQLMTIDSKINYATAVKNYEQVREQVHKFQIEIMPRINNISFT